MMSQIEKGDRVNVFFDRGEPEYNVQVMEFPAGFGDSWQLVRLDGTVVYVQTFTKMVRILSLEPEKRRGPVEEVMTPLSEKGEGK